LRISMCCVERHCLRRCMSAMFLVAVPHSHFTRERTYSKRAGSRGLFTEFAVPMWRPLEHVTPKSYALIASNPFHILTGRDVLNCTGH
jgi:hypothetical protein